MEIYHKLMKICMCVCWLDAYVNIGIIAIFVSFTYNNFILFFLFIKIIIFIWSAFVSLFLCLHFGLVKCGYREYLRLS